MRRLGNKRKTFDCVALKEELQRDLRALYRGLTPSALRKARVERLSSDPLLGPLYRRLASPSRRKRAAA